VAEEFATDAVVGGAKFGVAAVEDALEGKQRTAER
jgi:hypothetical protein